MKGSTSSLGMLKRSVSPLFSMIKINLSSQPTIKNRLIFGVFAAIVTSMVSGLAGPIGEPGPAGNLYFQPINPKLLKDPEIYGEKNTVDDNMLWARHLADQYATQMAEAGTPLTIEEYKDIIKKFYKDTEQKAKREPLNEIPREDIERFTSLIMTIPQLDTKKQAKQGTIPIEDIRSDFRAKRSLLLLTNADIKQEESLLPTEIDSEEVTREKIAYLKDLTKQQYHNAVNK
jgi:hypothetical protein